MFNFFQNTKIENMGSIKSFNGEDKGTLLVHEKLTVRRAVIPDYIFPLSSVLCVTPRVLPLILSLDSHFPYRFMYLSLCVAVSRL